MNKKLRPFQIGMHFDSYLDKNVQATSMEEALEKAKKLTMGQFIAKDVSWLDSNEEKVISVIDLHE